MIKFNSIVRLFIFVVFLFSCKKENLPAKNDIVYTDEYGNIIDGSNSTDWNILSIEDDEIFYPLSTTQYGPNGEPIIPDYNYNCSSDSLKIIV